MEPATQAQATAGAKVSKSPWPASLSPPCKRKIGFNILRYQRTSLFLIMLSAVVKLYIVLWSLFLLLLLPAKEQLWNCYDIDMGSEIWLK